MAAHLGIAFEVQAVSRGVVADPALISLGNAVHKFRYDFQVVDTSVDFYGIHSSTLLMTNFDRLRPDGSAVAFNVVTGIKQAACHVRFSTVFTVLKVLFTCRGTAREAKIGHFSTYL